MYMLADATTNSWNAHHFCPLRVQTPRREWQRRWPMRTVRMQFHLVLWLTMSLCAHWLGSFGSAQLLKKHPLASWPSHIRLWLWQPAAETKHPHSAACIIGQQRKPRLEPNKYDLTRHDTKWQCMTRNWHESHDMVWHDVTLHCIALHSNIRYLVSYHQAVVYTSFLDFFLSRIVGYTQRQWTKDLVHCMHWTVTAYRWGLDCVSLLVLWGFLERRWINVQTGAMVHALSTVYDTSFRPSWRSLDPDKCLWVSFVV